MANSQELDNYVNKLRELIKRVPASVNDGSYQQAVAYKAAVMDANKALSRPSLAKVKMAFNRLEPFYL